MESNKLPYGKIAAVQDLGQLIRAHRKANGLRQQDVANMAGVGLRFLSDLERGKKTVELGKVLLILAQLGLDLVCRKRGDDL